MRGDEQHRDGSGTNAASVNNGASITCQTPVLVMAKTPDGGTITAGQTATFTVVVTNNGPGTANNVVDQRSAAQRRDVDVDHGQRRLLDHRQRRPQTLSCTHCNAGARRQASPVWRRR